MVYLGIIGCAIILGLSWIKLKDIIAPPIILSSIWLLIYIALLLRKSKINFDNFYYLSFVFSLFCFILGFFMVVRNRNKTNFEPNRIKKKFNPFLGKLVIAINSVLFIFYLVKVRSYIFSNFNFNFWQTLNAGRRSGTFVEGNIVLYARIAIIAFSIVSSIIYFSNPKRGNKLYFLISIFFATIFVITANNRGIIFLLILSVFFAFLIIKNYDSMKTLIVLLTTCLILLAVFIVFSFLKFVYQDQSNSLQFIINQFRIYFTTPPLAFVQWIGSFHEYSYGANTFRFFSAILNSLGYNIVIPNTVQPFTWIYGDYSNVYTVLQYYSSDFGLIYAFFILFVLGAIHGYLYKESILKEDKKVFFIALQSVSYYPLIYQFFSDQYFTILSTWLQFLFWIWLFTRSFLLIDSKDKK
ncbi:hypothetical protein BpJC4_24300 [Weizmannia acidilactici]|uniref:O-antigen polymerase n=1 Tax=Heyndrickxia TaxID=2837504 RepID=UPI000211027B|nr:MULTISPECIES: O-antigen polymerase [Heyndrickxia]AEH52405.1 hypothetical protein BCO26_0346 [Heyndrickxia coagulans 2-6]GER67959.1 hypothetical protein BpJC4_24300 [Weizmannia acidilactici]